MVRRADRDELLAQEAAALRALTSHQQRAGMFEQRGVVATRETLVRKRISSLGRRWPAVHEALGEDFHDLAREYVLDRPRLTSDSRADGRAFAAWLDDRGRLADSAAVEVIRFDASYRLTIGGTRSRRLPAIRVRRRPRPTVAVSIPWPSCRAPMVVMLGSKPRTHGGEERVHARRAVGIDRRR
jgi:hypothetical protein